MIYKHIQLTSSQHKHLKALVYKSLPMEIFTSKKFKGSALEKLLEVIEWVEEILTKRKEFDYVKSTFKNARKNILWNRF